MIKRFSEFVNEGWAAGSMKRVGGRNIRKENTPTTADELRKIIKDRIEKEGNKCNLNDIDVSRMKDMSFLFNANTYDKFEDFNGDISGWDVSNVEKMNFMFYGCKNFNGDIGGWNVSKVNKMTYMFCDCEKFNQDIGGWNVSSVTDMSNMFEGCTDFNQDISGWNMSGVQYMSCMFRYCKNFNQDLSGWEISPSVSTMEAMFFGCDNFTSAKKLETWKKYTDTDMSYMFYGCPDKPEWYGKTKYGIQEIIADRIKDDGPDCDLNDIDISGISDMSFMFGVEYDYNDPVFKYFNGDVSGWDVSGVEYMNGMFYNCENFNRDISNWNVSNVKDMRHMFDGCTNFHNAKELKSWKNKLKDDVATLNMFDKCPSRPSWYKE